MWSDVNNSKSQGWLPGRATWGPLFLTVSPPIAAQVMALAQTRYDGSFTELYHAFMADNTAVLQQLLTWPSMEAVKMLAVFMIAQAVLMRVLPGKRTEGPVSPTGHVPVYKDNGMLSFVVAVLGFVGLSDVVLGEQGFYKLSVLADNYFDSICALNVFSLLFCLLLLIKGHVAPSSTDNGSSGSLVTDFYWGMELYPRIFGWDVKQFTNCRFGMMWYVTSQRTRLAPLHTLCAMSPAAIAAATSPPLLRSLRPLPAGGHCSPSPALHTTTTSLAC